jgi:hypothetical protein
MMEASEDDPHSLAAKVAGVFRDPDERRRHMYRKAMCATLEDAATIA